MPGIFAQTVIFGATITGAGLADDIQKGIIDRFRSLPMSPVGGAGRAHRRRRRLNNVIVDRRHVADRAGRRLADPHLGRSRRSRGFLLLLVFAYAISWVMALGRAAGAEPRRWSTTPRSS